MGESGYWIAGGLMALLTLGCLALIFVVFAYSGAISFKLIALTTGCFIGMSGLLGKASYMRTQRVLSDRADRL